MIKMNLHTHIKFNDWVWSVYTYIIIMSSCMIYCFMSLDISLFMVTITISLPTTCKCSIHSIHAWQMHNLVNKSSMSSMDKIAQSAIRQSQKIDVILLLFGSIDILGGRVGVFLECRRSSRSSFFSFIIKLLSLLYNRCSLLANVGS